MRLRRHDRIIFGNFGISVRPNGDIVVRRHQLPFASKMTLDGLKIRSHSFRVEIDGPKYQVCTWEQSFRSAMGNGEGSSFLGGNRHVRT